VQQTLPGWYDRLAYLIGPNSLCNTVRKMKDVTVTAGQLGTESDVLTIVACPKSSPGGTPPLQLSEYSAMAVDSKMGV